MTSNGFIELLDCTPLSVDLADSGATEYVVVELQDIGLSLSEVTDASVSNWEAIEVVVPGLQGPPGESGYHARRHDYAAPYDYCATALPGSSESAPVWTITRITVASNGTTTTATATSVSWTGRASATYS
jgi:hypothetical protein